MWAKPFPLLTYLHLYALDTLAPDPCVLALAAFHVIIGHHRQQSYEESRELSIRQENKLERLNFQLHLSKDTFLIMPIMMLLSENKVNIHLTFNKQKTLNNTECFFIWQIISWLKKFNWWELKWGWRRSVGKLRFIFSIFISDNKGNIMDSILQMPFPIITSNCLSITTPLSMQ